MEFEVLESLGGHLHGQVFLLFPAEGILFSADSLIGFDSLTPEREEFNIPAKNLMTSVNVDSEKAGQEGKACWRWRHSWMLSWHLLEKDASSAGGHGAISTVESGKLRTLGTIDRYKHKNPEPQS